jgi:hypothetical protein
MKKLTIVLLYLILAIFICGCFDNGKKEVNESNISVKDEITQNHKNKSIETIEIDNLKDNNKTNIKNNTKTKKYDFSKQIDIDEMFLNLPYDEEKNYDEIVIKKYKNITFEVSKNPIDLSYAYLFNEVKKYPQRDIFGNYTYYEFIPKNGNLSASYCYYRKIGKYYILMQTDEKSRKANDLWINWTKHIFGLFEENISE